MALHRDSTYRLTQLLRAAAAVDQLPADVDRLSGLLAAFERSAGQTKVVDMLADAVAAGDAADQPLLFTAALAERAASAEQAAEVVAAVRQRIQRRIRDAAAADGERIYRSAAARYDAVVGRFMAVVAVVDPEAPADVVVGMTDKARKAWTTAPELEAELDAAATALHACGVLAGLCADNNDSELAVVVDRDGLDRDLVVAAWNLRASERRDARAFQNSGPFSGIAAPTVSRCGRWSALLAAGATLRARQLELVG